MDVYFRCLQVQTLALPGPKPLKAILLHLLRRPHRLIPTARESRFFLSKNRHHVTSSVATVTAAASQKAERRAAGVCPVSGESSVRRAKLGGATLPLCWPSSASSFCWRLLLSSSSKGTSEDEDDEEWASSEVLSWWCVCVFGQERLGEHREQVAGEANADGQHGAAGWAVRLRHRGGFFLGTVTLVYLPSKLEQHLSLACHLSLQKLISTCEHSVVTAGELLESFFLIISFNSWL